MTNSLKGKRAVVTGGTRGIGRAIVERFLQEGMGVAFCGQSGDSVTRATGELSAQYQGKVFGKRCDVSKETEVAAFFAFATEGLGGLDVLVNNAGVGVFAPVEQMTPAEWHRMIDLNLSGVYYCCHQAIPLMKEAGGGYVINISSLAGKNPFAGGAGYNASKFGLNGFTEAMMLDHRRDDIRVSYIMPGSVDTKFSTDTPSPWKIAPEDIAEVVVMLVALPQRTLVSRVEMRPLKPPK
jgi:3-oxoacyl-[acyl-carrier protein] reductase